MNSLMKFSQDVHEKALVAKENELRRVCILLVRSWKVFNSFLPARQYGYHSSAKGGEARVHISEIP